MAGTPGSAAPAPATPLEQANPATALPPAVAGLQAAMHATPGMLADRALLRAHVERTLADFFGQPALTHDLHFQDIVGQVVDALMAESALQEVLQAACAELGKPPPPR